MTLAGNGGEYKGATFRVVRQAAATGAFNLAVGSKVLSAAGQWCGYVFDAAAWQEIASGSR